MIAEASDDGQKIAKPNNKVQVSENYHKHEEILDS